MNEISINAEKFTAEAIWDKETEAISIEDLRPGFPNRDPLATIINFPDKGVSICLRWHGVSSRVLLAATQSPDFRRKVEIVLGEAIERELGQS
jgi:hypothetical protein